MFAANQSQLQTSVFFTSETIYNFNVGFPNYKTDILLSLGLWQYWWWFWFAVLWSMYYLIAMKLVKARVFKMHARMNTSLRAHGKWGDFLVAALPLSWCCSILLNSTQILRMLEWQSEVNVMILRIHGKQWYWVYKLDQRNIVSVRGVARNAGKNRWWVNTSDDYSLGLCYIAEPTIKVQHEWTKAYKKKLKKKNIGFGVASNYYNNYFLNFAPKPTKTPKGLHFEFFKERTNKFRYARFISTGYYLPHPALTFDFGSGILNDFLNQNDYISYSNPKALQKKLVNLWLTLSNNNTFYTRSYNQNPPAGEFAVRKPFNMFTVQYLNARKLLVAHLKEALARNYFSIAQYGDSVLKNKNKATNTFRFSETYARLKTKQMAVEFFPVALLANTPISKESTTALTTAPVNNNTINFNYTIAPTPAYVKKILKNNYCRVAEYAANISLNKEIILPKLRSFSETYASLQTTQLKQDRSLTFYLLCRVRDIKYFAYWYNKMPHVKYKDETLWRKWRRLYPQLCTLEEDFFRVVNEYYSFSEAYAMLYARKTKDHYLTTFPVINKVFRPKRPKYSEFFVKKLSSEYIITYPYLCVPCVFLPIRDTHCFNRYITDYPYLCRPRTVNVLEDFKRNSIINYQFFYGILRNKRLAIPGFSSFTETLATLKARQVNDDYLKNSYTKKLFVRNVTNYPYLCLPRVFKTIEDFKKNSSIVVRALENLENSLAQSKNTVFVPYCSWSEPYVRLLIAKMENSYKSAYRQDLLHSIATISNVNFFKEIDPNLLYGKFEILHKKNVRPYLQHYFSDVIDDMWDVVSRAIPADPVGPFRVIKSVINNINYTDTTETIRHKFFEVNDNFFLKYMTDNEEFWLMYTRAQHRYSPAKGYDKKMAEVKPLYVNPIVHSRFIENPATSIKKKTSDINNFETPDLRSRSLWETWKTKQHTKNPTALSLDSEPVKLHNVVIHTRKRTEMVPEALASRLLRVRRPLIIPAHVNIGIVTNSYDVVHSWFIPGLGIKLDCVPGRSTHHTLYVDNVGHYYGQCAEICGRYHHHMPIRVCALPFEHFLVWWHRKGLALLLKPIVKPNLPEDEKVRLLKKFRRIALERHAW